MCNVPHGGIPLNVTQNHPTLLQVCPGIQASLLSNTGSGIGHNFGLLAFLVTITDNRVKGDKIGF